MRRNSTRLFQLQLSARILHAESIARWDLSVQIQSRDEVKNFPATPRFARLCTETEKIDALGVLQASQMRRAAEVSGTLNGGTGGAGSGPTRGRRKQPAGGRGGCCGAKPQKSN